MRKSDIYIHDYESGKSEAYVPPFEIQLLTDFHPDVSEIMQWIGSHPGLHKFIGMLSHKTKAFNGTLQSRMIKSGMSKDDVRQFCEKHDFKSSHELFTFNHAREHFGNGVDEPVLPSDGYLSHTPIEPIYRFSDGKIALDSLESSILQGVNVDISTMLGVSLSTTPCDTSILLDINLKDQVKRYVKPVLNNLFEDSSTLRGYHDLAILKPEHKHVCSVPLQSRVKFMYRVGMTGELYPHNQGVIRIDHEPVYSTDPSFVNKTDKPIFDGNQRMVFVMETEVGDKKMDYIMVAHAASLVSGIEPVVKIGDTIKPGEILFKFHQGSSLSTLWPRQFFEHFEFVAPLLQQTINGHLLKVLEGQRVYVPKGTVHEFQMNRSTRFVPSADGGNLVRAA